MGSNSWIDLNKYFTCKRYMKFLELKVYYNKKNGQSIVVLPKKKMNNKKLKKVKVKW